MDKVIALVLAGGSSTASYGVLVRNRAKAALPIAGQYRLVDFTLSNLANSGIAHVGLIIQFLPASLIEHVGAGESWDYHAFGRSLKMMPPFVGLGTTEWFKGSADALYQNLNFVRDLKPELVLVCSAEHVFEMDFDRLVRHHRANKADATIVTKVLPTDRLSSRFGYVEADGAGLVSNFIEKPSSPLGKRVSTGTVLFNAPLLVRLLTDNAKRVDTSHNLSRDIVQGMVGRYRVFAQDIEEEWEYLETVYDYFGFQQSLLSNPDSNIIARMQLMTNLKDRGLDERAPIEFSEDSSVENALISPGCVIRGTVSDSILSPGVVVEKGARVENAILFHDAVVRPDAHLQYVIADKGSVFEPGCRVGGIVESERPRARMWPMRNALTLIGKDCRVGKGVVIPPDMQLSHGEEVLEPSSAGILEPMEVSR